MTNLASLTIDRHEPTIPDNIQGEISIEEEHLKTKIKNSFVLKYCNVGQIKRWVKNKPNPPAEPPKTITNKLLGRAQRAADKCKNKLLKSHLVYLHDRNVTKQDIDKFGICSTQELCRNLEPNDVKNLSLRISDKFSSIVDDHTIDGISIPFFKNGIFHGFCTRILNNAQIKYSITIPHRYCFGIDFSKRDSIYVVEGVFDAIRMIRDGNNCMALGDSQPNYYKMLMANKFDHVNLLFDNDYSGLLGAAKAHIILEEMLKRDPNSMSILVPNYKDPSINSGGWVKHTLRQTANKLTIMGREQ